MSRYAVTLSTESAAYVAATVAPVTIARPHRAHAHTKPLRQALECDTTPA